METNELSVLLLHEHAKYLKACCDLINDEWPRSETARMISLEASCDDLPTSLILVNRDKLILGHLKLTRIPAIPESCFIETVVINKTLRGRKLGSYLMKKAEEYCKNNLKRTMVHLSTKGQEKFYEKLGYVTCEPVSIYGCSVPNNSKTPVQSNGLENLDRPPQNNSNLAIMSDESAPPPPPPMPVTKTTTNKSIKSSKTFMYKYI